MIIDKVYKVQFIEFRKRLSEGKEVLKIIIFGFIYHIIIIISSFYLVIQHFLIKISRPTRYLFV